MRRNLNKIMLCLSCFRWTTSGSLFCSGCGKSYGARYCGSKKRHANVMNTQFCSQCGSQKLTDATLYLPLGWLIRGLVLAVLLLVARNAWDSLVPFAKREWAALIIVLCPILNALLNGIVCAALFYWLVWIFASLLPFDVGKPIQNTLRSGVGLLLKIVNFSARALLRVLWQILFGNSKPRST